MYHSLHDLIKSIQSDVTISPKDLLQTFLCKNAESVNRTLERVGFEIDSIEKSVISPFASESPSILYIKFELLVTCRPIVDDGRHNGRLILEGDGRLDMEAGAYSELRNFGEEFLYIAADGSEEKTKNQVIFVDSLVIGHKEVTHSVHYKLE